MLSKMAFPVDGFFPMYFKKAAFLTLEDNIQYT